MAARHVQQALVHESLLCSNVCAVNLLFFILEELTRVSVRKSVVLFHVCAVSILFFCFGGVVAQFARVSVYSFKNLTSRKIGK